MAVPCKRRPLTARQKRRGAARGSRWVAWSCRSGRRTSGRQGPGGPSRGGERARQRGGTRQASPFRSAWRGRCLLIWVGFPAANVPCREIPKALLPSCERRRPHGSSDDVFGPPPPRPSPPWNTPPRPPAAQFLAGYGRNSAELRGAELNRRFDFAPYSVCGSDRFKPGLHDAELSGYQGAGDGDKGEGDHGGGDEAACLFYEHVGGAAMGGSLGDWPAILNNFVGLWGNSGSN